MTIANQLISFRLSGVNFVGSPTQLNYTSGVDVGSATASKALVLDSNKSASGVTNLQVQTLACQTMAGTMTTASQPNITSVGTLSSLTVGGVLNVRDHNGVDKGLQLGGGLVTASAAELNYVDTTAGTAEASKALVLNAGKSISGIASLQSSALQCTTISIGGSWLTTSAEKLNYVDTIAGTAEASKAILLDNTKSVSGLSTLGASNVVATTLTGTLTTANQPNITSVGTLSSLALSGAVTGVTNLQLSGNLTGATTVSATTLTGTLSTSSQPNVTSVGTLTSLSVSGSIQVPALTCTTLTLGSTALTASATELNTLTGVTAGTATGGKSLVVNAQRSISSLNQIQAESVSATVFAGTLTTASQPNVTSVGTLSSLSTSGAIQVGVTNDSSTITTLTQWVNGAASNVVARVETTNAMARVGTTTTHPFRIMSNNASILSVETNGSVNIGSTTPTEYRLNVTGGVNASSLSLNQSLVTASASEINVLTGVSAGTCSVGKALVVNASAGISGITSLGATTVTATNLVGTLTTASQPNVTSVGTLTSLSISANPSTTNLTLASTAAASRANIVFTNNTRSMEIGLKGTSDSSPANTFYIYDTAADIVRLNIGANGNVSLDGNSTIYKLNVSGSLNIQQLFVAQTQVDSTASELNYLAGLTQGTAQASKALVLNASKNISGIGSLSATTLAGTLQTAAQPNITSVGTLTSLSLNDGDITGVSNLVMDGNLTGVSTLSATYINGAIQTGSQVGITSVGTLDSLKTTGAIKIGTPSSSAEDMLHLESNVNGVVGIQLENRNTTSNSGSYIKFTGYYDSSSNYDLASITCGYVAVNSAYGHGYLAFATRDNQLAATATERMRIAQDGSVGIGTTSPSYKLHVAGSLNATSLYIGGTQVQSSADDLNNLYSVVAGSASPNRALVLNSSLNITGINALTASTLIGTLQTAAQPNVTSVGTLSGVKVAPTSTTMTYNSTSYSITNALVMSTGNNLWGITQPSSNSMSFGCVSGSSWVDQMVLTNSTQLGIGCTPKCRLHLGATAANYILGLFNPVASSSDFYGFGANSSMNLYHAKSGHQFFLNSKEDALGTIAATFGSGGLNIVNGLDVSTNAFSNGVAAGIIAHYSVNSSAIATTGSADKYNICLCNSSTTNGEMCGISMLCDSFAKNTTTPTCAIKGVRSGTNGAGGLAFATRSGTLVTDSCSTKMSILGNGNVGIGTTSPSYLLDVNGAARASQLLLGTSTDTSRVIACTVSMSAQSEKHFLTFGAGNSGANQGELAFYYNAAGDAANNLIRLGLYGASDRLTLNGNGYVGIGVGTPTSSLHINQHASTSCIRLDYDSANSTYNTKIGTFSNGKLYVDNGATFGSTTNSGYGYVYIAGSEYSNIGSYAYHNSVNNTGTASSNNIQCSLRTANRIVCGAEIDIVSDRRIKDNVQTLSEEYCMRFVDVVVPKKFNYKKTPEKTNHGFIAQELWKAGFSDLVNITYEEGVDEEVDDDGFVSPKDHIFTVTLEEVVPILTKSIQVLKRERDEMRRELDELKALVMEKLK